jgi:DNA-binding LacI/PurR family transcriptional regulator
MANIKKVADRANVSVATVSRVLNGAENVQTKTKLKVEAAIEELNYVPNMLARNLRISRSKSLLVILTSISNLFYMEIVHGISKYAANHGYDILLSETNGELSRQIECLEKIKNHIADGAIILESTIHDDALITLEKNHPIVQCCTYNDDIDLPYIVVDNEKGGHMATRELIAGGRRRLAFVGTNDKSRYNRERRAGFYKAVDESGIRRADVIAINETLSFEGGAASTGKLLEFGVDGAFFVSDMQAIGALHALGAKGVKVPDDIAVIGYDNLEICDLVSPPLTSIDQPAREMGRCAARMLIQIIGGEDKPPERHITFQPKLIRRKSISGS